KHYYVQEAGFKYNMMDLQAAIGIHQLRSVEEHWQKRRHVWHRYSVELANLPITLPADPDPDTRHAYHLYGVLVDKSRCGISRDEFLDDMTAHNIGVGVHYLSIPEHPYYQENYGWKPEDLPQAQRIGRRTVSLPLSAKLTSDDCSDVALALQTTLDSQTRKRGWT